MMCKEVAGVVFKGTCDMFQEAEDRMLLGASKENLELVDLIKPGMPLFFLDLTTDKLLAGFEAASEGRRNIERDAFDGALPAQVRVRIVRAFISLSKKEYMGILRRSDNYDVNQVLCLSKDQVDELQEGLKNLINKKSNKSLSTNTGGSCSSSPRNVGKLDDDSSNINRKKKPDPVKAAMVAAAATTTNSKKISPSSYASEESWDSGCSDQMYQDDAPPQLHPHISMTALSTNENGSNNNNNNNANGKRASSVDISTESTASSCGSTCETSSSSTMSCCYDDEEDDDVVGEKENDHNKEEEGVGGQQTCSFVDNMMKDVTSPKRKRELAIVVDDDSNSVPYLEPVNESIDRFLENVNKCMNIRPTPLANNQQEYDLSCYSGNDASMIWLRVQEVVRSLYGAAVVQIYGSFATGLWLPGQSDLDLLISFQRSYYPTTTSTTTTTRPPRNAAIPPQYMNPIGPPPPAEPEQHHHQQDEKKNRTKTGQSTQEGCNSSDDGKSSYRKRSASSASSSSSSSSSGMVAMASTGTNTASPWPSMGSSSSSSSSTASSFDMEIDRKQILTYLCALHSALKVQPWCKSIKLIKSSSMPVIKMVAMNQYFVGTQAREIPVDISFRTADHYGLQARDYVLQLTEDLPDVLRPLVLVLKRLLREYNLHDVYTGGLGSYSLTVLVTFFLLRCGFQISDNDDDNTTTNNNTKGINTNKGFYGMPPHMHPFHVQPVTSPPSPPMSPIASPERIGQVMKKVNPETIPDVFQVERTKNEEVEWTEKDEEVIQQAKMVIDGATNNVRASLIKCKEEDAKIDIGSLLMGFLQLFASPANGGLDLSMVGISLENRGQIFLKAKYQQAGPLCIRDPVVHDHYLGAGSFNLHQVQQKFTELHDMLMLKPGMLETMLQMEQGNKVCTNDNTASLPPQHPGAMPMMAPPPRGMPIPYPSPQQYPPAMMVPPQYYGPFGVNMMSPSSMPPNSPYHHPPAPYYNYHQHHHHHHHHHPNKHQGTQTSRSPRGARHHHHHHHHYHNQENMGRHGNGHEHYSKRPKPSESLTIRNLPYQISESEVESLLEKFREFGIIKNMQHTPEQGTMYLVFESSDQASSAMFSLNKHPVKGRTINIRYSDPSRQHHHQQQTTPRACTSTATTTEPLQETAK